MKVLKKIFDAALYLEIPRFEDLRGSFTKLYGQKIFRNLGIDTELREVYYSVSARNVIRGMHFQEPPAHHGKLVTVACGSVRDVILDLRKNSPTYGKTADILLSGKKAEAFYIPPGFAHGFLSLEDNTLMQYLVSSEHCPEHDKGIRWDSIPFDWGVAKPLLSERDLHLPPFREFESPF
ncbi:MAG: dTDP-4-dehydrorhamnose 3,5-epimerase family protein [Candidatus Marinimicrobia bacterium]|nr:dTDP-4-dehydrorhamnose 3,5-epimerase family protein [Candidatus Neomarinimicrobiota bacterium]